MRADALQIGIVQDGRIPVIQISGLVGDNPISVSGCMVLYVERGYAIISIRFKSRDFMCRFASHS